MYFRFFYKIETEIPFLVFCWVTVLLYMVRGAVAGGVVSNFVYGLSGRGRSELRINYRALPLFFITAATAKAAKFVVENNFPRNGGWAVAAIAKSTGAPSGRSRKIRIFSQRCFAAATAKS